MAAKHPILVKLGENVRAARTAKGLSQEGLALDSDLDRTYVGGIERGERNVSVLNVCKIASALNVAPESLLRGLADQKGPLDTI